MDKPTVHLFFNGTECYFPPGSAWEKFRGLDAARTFSICAESWRRNGWNVKRLSTERPGVTYHPTPFLEGGECSKSFGWYPAPYWQFVAKAKQVAVHAPFSLHWFATIDVINYGFRPPLNLTAPRGHSESGDGCYSFQREHFSMALLCCTFEWLEDAEKILLRYDRGELPALQRDYTSDETILRNYAKAASFPDMTFACNTQKDSHKLLHFSRSAIPPHYSEFQLSA